MRQKHSYLTQFRAALADLHTAARARFAPAQSDQPDAKVAVLTLNERLAKSPSFLKAAVERHYPPESPAAAEAETPPAPALDHQGALRALMDYHRQQQAVGSSS